MSEAAESNESAPAADSKPAGGGSKLVMIVTLVNMLATVGIGGVLFMSYQKEAAKPSVEDIVAGQKEDSHGSGGHGAPKADAHGGGHGAKKADAHGAPKADAHGGGHGGGHGAAAAPAEEEAEVDSGKIIGLEPFTVNLTVASGTLPRYIRMNISVELEKGNTDEEFKTKTPRVRDTVISLLNSKKPNDVSSPQGRDLLKDEMKRALNSFLTTGKVADIYFTNFAVSN